MSFARARPIERVVGHTLLLGALVGGGVLAAQPSLQQQAGRVRAALVSGVESARDDDGRFPLAIEKGVVPGLPVYLLDGDAAARPIGHVLAVEGVAPDRWLRVRWAPGEAAPPHAELLAYEPSRKLHAALDLAVPPEEAKRFAVQLVDRLGLIWSERVQPDAVARMPAFLARIDPAGDTEAKALTEALGNDLVWRLEPMLDGLAKEVTKAVEAKFNLLDRLGLLLKVVRGDGNGLRNEILPVAKDAASRWWSEHQETVLGEIGKGLGENMPAIRKWIEGELLSAFVDELLGPIWANHREALEREGELLLREAAHAFVEAPGGGFRVRFASMLRHNLLGKRTALLLVREGSPHDAE